MNNETDNRQSISKEELKKIFDSIEDTDVRCSFSDCNFKYNAFNEVDISSFEKGLFSFSNCIFDCELLYTTNIDYFVNCVFNERVYLHERKSNKNYYFTDCIFNNMVFIENQKDFSGDKLFIKCKFPKYIFPRNKDIDVPNINIKNTTFKNSFELVENEIHHILITDTIFSKPIYIDNKLKINLLRLDNCKLEDGFLINNKYSNHMFSIKGLSLLGCNINGSFIARDCKIENLNLENSIFNEKIDLVKSSLNSTNFKNTIFNNVAIFENTTFENDIHFEFTTFGKLASFKNTLFKKTLNLEDAIITNEMNFFQTNENTINVANRETARLIKYSFNKIGNTIESNKYKSLELKQYTKYIWSCEKFMLNLILDGIVMFFHYISSNYSQNWLLPIIWIFSIGIITSYCISDINLSNIFKFMYIATSPDDFKDNAILIFFNKVLLGYLYYQFLVTIRKDTK